MSITARPRGSCIARRSGALRVSARLAVVATLIPASVSSACRVHACVWSILSRWDARRACICLFFSPLEAGPRAVQHERCCPGEFGCRGRRMVAKGRLAGRPFWKGRPRGREGLGLGLAIRGIGAQGCAARRRWSTPALRLIWPWLPQCDSGLCEALPVSRDRWATGSIERYYQWAVAGPLARWRGRGGLVFPNARL